MEKEVGSPNLLFENLDLTPIQLILWKGLHREGLGKPVVYNPVRDLRALMLRQTLQRASLNSYGSESKEILKY